MDHIDLAACKARGVHVGHTPGVLTVRDPPEAAPKLATARTHNHNSLLQDSTADLAVALTFATVRKIVPGVAAVKNGAAPSPPAPRRCCLGSSTD